MFTYILCTVIGATLVLVGADKLTDGAVGMASRFGISELVIGLTIVAFGTSLPEFIVSLLACISNDVSATALSTRWHRWQQHLQYLYILGVFASVKPLAVTGLTIARLRSSHSQRPAFLAVLAQQLQTVALGRMGNDTGLRTVSGMACN